ncbi:MAG: AhpC/TSA family protein [Sphingobacteriales bacterium]|nr:MAG: AhpC/TSA family protein [Sphingobacteriales bacterium]
MRNVFFLLTAILLSYNANAQKTIISGKITNLKDEKIKISYQKGMALPEFKEVKKETTLDSTGNFTMELDLDAPAVVTIAFNEKILLEFGGLTGHSEVQLFLEPGNQIFVDLSPEIKGEPSTFKGKGAENNNFLLQFNYKFLRGNIYNVTKEKLANASSQEYLLFLDSLASAQLTFFNKNAAALSPNFKTYITNKINYQNASDKLFYPVEKRSITQQEVQLPADYYKFLEKVQIQNDDALYMWEYFSFIDYLLSYEVEQQAKKAQQKDSLSSVSYYQKAKYNLAKSYFTSKTRDFALASSTFMIIDYLPFAEAEIVVSDFRNQVAHKELADYVIKHFEERRKLLESEIAPAFTLKDAKEKDVSLKDFRGKVVYMCFWASWCEPCKKEVPYALKLQEQFKEKDVVFLYVSTDESDDLWKKAIRSHFAGKGLHVISKKSADNIQEKYNMSGIPAYFIIDREGKIMDDNANRPSEEITAKVLDEVLNIK